MNDIWYYPLEKANLLPDEKGVFGANRLYNTHEGVDLYGNEGDFVFSVENGVVVSLEWFTGEKCSDYPSPWWNNTQALLVEGESGVVVYGEIKIKEGLKVGDKVKRAELLGTLSTVLKKDKGRPMTMLHIELHKHGSRKTYSWDHDKTRPLDLLDPTLKIEESFYDKYEGKISEARYKERG